MLSRHADNDANAEDPEKALTCYRTPLFAVTIIVSDKSIGHEEKAILDRLET